MLKPNVYFREIEKKTLILLETKLLQYKLIINKEKSKELTNILMPHLIRHSVGLNVHDEERTNWILKKNDIITIEPGIYFPEKVKDYNGINKKLYNKILKKIKCIRIEDTLIITQTGYKSLTKLPVEIKDINKLIIA